MEIQIGTVAAVQIIKVGLEMMDGMMDTVKATMEVARVRVVVGIKAKGAHGINQIKVVEGGIKVIKVEIGITIILDQTTNKATVAGLKEVVPNMEVVMHGQRPTVKVEDMEVSILLYSFIGNSKLNFPITLLQQMTVL